MAITSAYDWDGLINSIYAFKLNESKRGFRIFG